MIPYLEIYLGTVALQFVVESVLEWRQYKMHQTKTLPKELSNLVTQEEFASSQLYNADKRIFTGVFRVVHVGILMVMLKYGNVIAWELAPSTGYAKAYLWLMIMGFMELPLEAVESAIGAFVVEEKHGFNKMTWSLFFTDMVKNQLISMVTMGIIMPALLWVIDNGGDKLVLYLWGFLQTLVLVIMLIYPNVIMPLFNKFEPLKDQELKQKIEQLAADLKFPLTNLFEIDGSKRSSHSNAFFYGFGGKKGIVLYDTLLHLDHDKILAILCHELGHWKFWHLWRTVFVVSLNLFMMCALFQMCMTDAAMFAAFGFPNARDTVIGFVMFQKVFSPAEAVFMRFMNGMQRRNEHQADSFAVKLGYGGDMKAGLEAISKENKGSLCPDPYYAWYHFSHPGLLERLQYVDKCMKENGAGEKKETKKTQ
jgi:STE24 endopeptidase